MAVYNKEVFNYIKNYNQHIAAVSQNTGVSAEAIAEEYDAQIGVTLNLKNNHLLQK